jgi:hypothetical protein
MKPSLNTVGWGLTGVNASPSSSSSGKYPTPHTDNNVKVEFYKFCLFEGLLSSGMILYANALFVCPSVLLTQPSAIILD